MARYVANVDIATETFGTWVVRTNTLLDALSTEIITANATYANTGNTSVPRTAQLFGTMGANTLIATDAIRGGNNAASANLNITSNAIFTGASLNVASNSTFTANVTANGANVFFDGCTFLAAPNTNTAIYATPGLIALRSTGIQLRSNTSVAAIIVSGNGTTTNTTISGNSYLNSANAVYNGSTFTATANLAWTAANVVFNSNSSITALSITGNSTATNTAIGGSAFNVAANVAIVGSVHTITGNVNIDAGTLFVDQATNRVGINTTTPAFPLDVQGAASVSTSANVGTMLNVGGNTSIGGFVNVVSTANVGGATSLRSTLTVNGAVTIANTLSVTNNTSIAGFINVSSTANVGGATNLRSTLAVNGAVTIANTLYTGNTEVTGYVNTSSYANVATTLQVGTNASVGGFINVVSTANVGGAVTLRSTLTVNGAVTIANTLSVTNNTSIAGFVNVSSYANVGGTLTVGGNTSITGTVSATGNASFGQSTTLGTDLVIDVVANNDVGSNTTAPQLVYSFPKATYRTGRLTIQASRSGNNQIAEMLVAHDGTDAYATVYGVIASPPGGNTVAPLGTFTAAINNANVEIKMAQVLSNSAVKIIAQLIK